MWTEPLLTHTQAWTPLVAAAVWNLVRVGMSYWVLSSGSRSLWWLDAFQGFYVHRSKIAMVAAARPAFEKGQA